MLKIGGVQERDSLIKKDGRFIRKVLQQRFSIIKVGRCWRALIVTSGLLALSYRFQTGYEHGDSLKY